MPEIHMVTREEMIRDMADPGLKDRKALRELQERYHKLFSDYVDCSMAVGLVTGHFPPFNETLMERAKAFLEKRKSEWLENHSHRKD